MSSNIEGVGSSDARPFRLLKFQSVEPHHLKTWRRSLPPSVQLMWELTVRKPAAAAVVAKMIQDILREPVASLLGDCVASAQRESSQVEPQRLTVSLRPYRLNERGWLVGDDSREHQKIDVPPNDEWTTETVDAVNAQIAKALNAPQIEVSKVHRPLDRAYVQWVASAGTTSFKVDSPVQDDDETKLPEAVFRHLRRLQVRRPK